MKVLIQMILKYEKEKQNEILYGIWKEEEQELFFKDQNQNGMHFYIEKKQFVRETKQAIFNYFFEPIGTLEVYLKEEKRKMILPFQTFLYERSNHSFEVHYQMEGNDFIHQLRLDWEMRK